MHPTDVAIPLFFVAWACGAIAIAASEVLQTRLHRALRERHPERWKALRGRAARRHFFVAREHLRLDDPALDADAERLRMVDVIAVGLFFGGIFVIVVNSVVLAALRG
jgi:hypothetical protein